MRKVVKDYVHQFISPQHIYTYKAFGIGIRLEMILSPQLNHPVRRLRVAATAARSHVDGPCGHSSR